MWLGFSDMHADMRANWPMAARRIRTYDGDGVANLAYLASDDRSIELVFQLVKRESIDISGACIYMHALAVACTWVGMLS